MLLLVFGGGGCWTPLPARFRSAALASAAAPRARGTRVRLSLARGGGRWFDPRTFSAPRARAERRGPRTPHHRVLPPALCRRRYRRRCRATLQYLVAQCWRHLAEQELLLLRPPQRLAHVRVPPQPRAQRPGQLALRAPRRRNERRPSGMPRGEASGARAEIAAGVAGEAFAYARAMVVRTALCPTRPEPAFFSSSFTPSSRRRRASSLSSSRGVRATRARRSRAKRLWRRPRSKSYTRPPPVAASSSLNTDTRAAREKRLSDAAARYLFHEVVEVVERLALRGAVRVHRREHGAERTDRVPGSHTV